MDKRAEELYALYFGCAIVGLLAGGMRSYDGVAEQADLIAKAAIKKVTETLKGDDDAQ
jgi:hypothetical protein